MTQEGQQEDLEGWGRKVILGAEPSLLIGGGGESSQSILEGGEARGTVPCKELRVRLGPQVLRQRF